MRELMRGLSLGRRVAGARAPSLPDASAGAAYPRVLVRSATTTRATSRS